MEPTRYNAMQFHVYTCSMRLVCLYVRTGEKNILYSCKHTQIHAHLFEAACCVVLLRHKAFIALVFFSIHLARNKRKEIRRDAVIMMFLVQCLTHKCNERSFNLHTCPCIWVYVYVTESICFRYCLVVCETRWMAYPLLLPLELCLFDRLARHTIILDLFCVCFFFLSLFFKLCVYHLPWTRNHYTVQPMYAQTK